MEKKKKKEKGEGAELSMKTRWWGDYWARPKGGGGAPRDNLVPNKEKTQLSKKRGRTRREERVGKGGRAINTRYRGWEGHWLLEERNKQNVALFRTLGLDFSGKIFLFLPLFPFPFLKPNPPASLLSHNNSPLTPISFSQKNPFHSSLFTASPLQYSKSQVKWNKKVGKYLKGGRGRDGEMEMTCDVRCEWWQLLVANKGHWVITHPFSLGAVYFH